MRRIAKQAEPRELAEFRACETADWRPTFEALTPETKSALQRSLPAEQGWICCYCNDRIEGRSWHIEHVKPQSAFPALALEYGNMVASCPGSIDEPRPRVLHCGYRKDHRYDPANLVSPLDEDCEACFTFTSAGVMAASQASPRAPAAAETIRRLGLDCARLVEKRRKAIVGWSPETLSPEELEIAIAALGRQDASGRYSPFGFAIAQVLSRYGPPRKAAPDHASPP